jgi:hypothetical protein
MKLLIKSKSVKLPNASKIISSCNRHLFHGECIISQIRYLFRNLYKSKRNTNMDKAHISSLNGKKMHGDLCKNIKQNFYFRNYS